MFEERTLQIIIGVCLLTLVFYGGLNLAGINPVEMVGDTASLASAVNSTGSSSGYGSSSSSSTSSSSSSSSGGTYCDVESVKDPSGNTVERYKCKADSSNDHECSNDADCNIFKHAECSNADPKNSSCEVVPGVGLSQCQNDNDCKTRTHNICGLSWPMASIMCQTVAGSGTNECGLDSDCVKYKYNACEPVAPVPGCATNFKCVVKLGRANNQCTKDADCNGRIYDFPATISYTGSTNTAYTSPKK